MKARKLWAAGDGNGGYDIGEADFTLASVRNIRLADGYRVGKAYEAATGAPFDPRALAMLFKASPAMLAVLERVGAVLDMSDPDNPAFVDSGADCLQALCEMEADIRAAIAAAVSP